MIKWEEPLKFASIKFVYNHLLRQTNPQFALSIFPPVFLYCPPTEIKIPFEGESP